MRQRTHNLSLSTSQIGADIMTLANLNNFSRASVYA